MESEEKGTGDKEVRGRHVWVRKFREGKGKKRKGGEGRERAGRGEGKGKWRK